MGGGQIGKPQVGAFQSGTAQVGKREVGSRQVGVGQVGTTEASMNEVGPAEVGTGELGSAEFDIVEVGTVDKGVLQGEARRVVVRINSLGTYTARCPVEGKIMDLYSASGNGVSIYQTNALWVQTDEGDDVVLQFRGYRFGLAPKSFVRFGERLGQGSRCAYLRLARYAEVHIPIDSTILVEPGQRVVAGNDLLAKLPHA